MLDAPLACIVVVIMVLMLMMVVPIRVRMITVCKFKLMFPWGLRCK